MNHQHHNQEFWQRQEVQQLNAIEWMMFWQICSQRRAQQQTEQWRIEQRTQAETIAEAILRLPLNQTSAVDRVKAQVLLDEKRARLARAEAERKYNQIAICTVLGLVALGCIWLWGLSECQQSPNRTATEVVSAPAQVAEVAQVAQPTAHDEPAPAWKTPPVEVRRATLVHAKHAKHSIR